GEDGLEGRARINRADLDDRELDELARKVGIAPRLEHAVHVHYEVEVVVRGDVEKPAPDVETGRHLAVRIEGSVSVEPFADQRGAVSGLLEPGRHGVAAIAHAVPAIGIEVAAHA